MSPTGRTEANRLFLVTCPHTNNNPVRYTDPSGRFAFVTVLAGGVIGAVAGLAVYTAYTASTGYNWDPGQAIVATGTFALAGAMIGTGVGAAAGIGMAANASLEIAASGVGAGVAGGAYGYIAQSAFTHSNFKTSSFAISSAGGAVDGGISVAIPSVSGRMAASGVLTGIQGAADARMHNQHYNSGDFLDDIASGVFARGFGEGMAMGNLGPRYVEELGGVVRENKLMGRDADFAIRVVAKQEAFIGIYDSVRAGLISSGALKCGIQDLKQMIGLQGR